MGYLKEKLLSGYPKNEEVAIKIQKIKQTKKEEKEKENESKNI